MWEKNLLDLELLQSNWFERERFNGLPSSGDHVRQRLNKAGILSGLKSLSVERYLCFAET